jgi:hypothetical protein
VSWNSTVLPEDISVPSSSFSASLLAGIDPDATIWTAKVNSVSSKLALRDGQLLVPLTLGSVGGRCPIEGNVSVDEEFVC